MDASPALLIGLGISGALLLALGGAWLLHLFLLRQARNDLEDYKSQVVALSEKIDALKERHKLLPHLDQDFTVPMTGETLAAYSAVSEQLDRLRREWLRLMDVWEQAQSQVDSEWLLGIRRARQARRQIREAAVADALAALLRDCEAPLNHIEKAHAEVATRLQGLEQLRQQLARHEQALREASLSVEAYQADHAVAQSLIERANTVVQADPLSALRNVEDAQAKLAQLNQKAVKILEHVHTARATGRRMDEVAQLACQRREQGFFLREAEANPDPRLNQAREQQSAAWEFMNHGDELAAGQALAKVQSLIDEAQQGIEAHLAACGRCETEIPLRRSESLRLGELQAAASRQRQELERDFAPQAWSPVADNAAHAHGLLASALNLVEQAAQDAAANVQNYCQAQRLLAEVAKHHKQAEQALAAIGRRLCELVEIRGQCQKRVNQIVAKADSVGQLLRSSTADRVPANERFRSAHAALQAILDETRMTRPDWQPLLPRLDAIESDLKRAEQLAHDDRKVADQAANEIAEAEAAVRQAASYGQVGIRADVASAEGHLSQARVSLAAQDYEGAVRLANTTERAAREALNIAKSNVARRKQEMEAQRRPQMALPHTTAPQESPILQAEADDPAVQEIRV